MIIKRIVTIMLVLAMFGGTALVFAEGNKETEDQNFGYGWRNLKLRDEKGLLVTGVVEDGPAYKAGIARGDIILALEGEKTDKIADVYRILRDKRAAETVTFSIKHGSETKDVDLQIEDKLFEEPIGLALSESGRRGLGFPGLNFPFPHKDGMGNWIERLDDFAPGMMFRFHNNMFHDTLPDLDELPEGVDTETLAFSAVVAQVYENSPAEMAGIMEGDLIIKVNGEDLTEDNSLQEVIASYVAGDSIIVSLLRDEAEDVTELSVTLDENDDGNAFLGIRYRTFPFLWSREFDMESPFHDRGIMRFRLDRTPRGFRGPGGNFSGGPVIPHLPDKQPEGI